MRKNKQIRQQTLKNPSKSQTKVQKIQQAPKNIDSKKTNSEIEPRITRRMTKMKQYSQSVVEKCVICLGSYKDNNAKLTCGHTFCLDCVIQWWRDHPNCPFCREEILLITKEDGAVVRFEDIPPVEKSIKDEDFIPHCQLCWGEIESFEQMNICTLCRSVYWHRRCLPYSNTRWYCIECAGTEDDE